MNLNNKKILITGASDGIGKHIALKLAKEKTKLILLGRDITRLKETKKECEDLGALAVFYYSVDFLDTDQFLTTTNSIIEDHSDISILINNAGIWQKLGELDSISNNIVEKLVNVNLTSLIKLTNSLLPNLRKQKEAAILNISSKAGVFAQKGMSVYTATKYGVRGFTDVLKEDLKDSTIQVAGLYQSGTNTSMFKKSGDDFPIQKFTEPGDLADVVVFMLSRPDKIWLNDVRVSF